MRQYFSSRFALVIAALGMAIGTGNIWRFPRIAANHEGGAFLIPWLIFLFTWSIPILIAEFTLGKVTGRGPVGAFASLLGRRAAWMGAFMAFVTLMIASYYSVVTGWTLRYAVDSIGSLGTALPAVSSPEAIAASHAEASSTFSSFAESGWSLVYHLASVAIGILVVWRGIRGGVELATKILVPLLFLLLIAGSIWALTSLEGAERGVAYFFTPNWSLLSQPKIWIDGLSQSAWSTGAGWGLILAYGAYAGRRDDAVAINRAAAFGNNTASLLAGLFIFPAVFALLAMAGYGHAEVLGALKDNGPGNTGLAFTYIPFIFRGLGEAGGYATAGFFTALFFAALSSLIAMYEMGIRVLMDTGLSRSKSALAIGFLCAGAGSFAALDMDVFVTLDWVWGLGLVIGGLLVVWAVQTYGTDRYRRKLINDRGARRPLTPFFNTLFVYLLPLQGIALLGWWLYDAATNPGYFDPGNAGVRAWDPLVLGTYGIGPCVIWWLTALGIFIAFSPWLGAWSLRGEQPAHPGPEDAPRLLLRLPCLLISILPWLLYYGSDRIASLVDQAGSGTTPWWILGIAIPAVLLGGFFRWAFLATRPSDGDAGREQQEEDLPGGN